MNPFEDFQKHAMREAMNRVYLWKHEHPDEYSRFSVEMMKVERNDFSCLERIQDSGRLCADIRSYRMS